MSEKCPICDHVFHRKIDLSDNMAVNTEDEELVCMDSDSSALYLHRPEELQDVIEI